MPPRTRPLVANRTLALSLLILTTTLSPAGAATLHVPGAFPTIQAAVDASSAPGDTVLVAPGSYPESVAIADRVLHIIGSGGSGLTTVGGITWIRQTTPPSSVLCGGTVAGFQIDGPSRLEYNSQAVSLRDVVFDSRLDINGDFSGIAGLRIEECTFLDSLEVHSSLTSFPSPELILRCDFPAASHTVLSTRGVILQECTWTGGSVFAHGEWNNCQVFDCNLVAGAQMIASADDEVIVTGCSFEGTGSGTALEFDGFGGCTISGNTITGYATGIDGPGIPALNYFTENTIADCDTAVDIPLFIDFTNNIVYGCDTGLRSLIMESNGSLSGNTFTKITGVAVEITDPLENLTVGNNIVAENGQGIVFQNVEAPISTTCNDVWSNPGGNWTGIADPTGTGGNISADPLFCDSSSLAGLGLDAKSPCAPGNHPDGFACGQIGAKGVECGKHPSTVPGPITVPSGLVLHPVQPNPVRGGEASIRFELPHATSVQLELFDVRGRRIAAMVAEFRSAGRQTVPWEDLQQLAPGGLLAPGVYYLRVLAEGRHSQRQVVVLQS